MMLSLNALGVSPGGRAYFLLLRQKKVAKEKATPGSVSGYAGFPALLETPGGWLNSPAAQTTPAEGPRHFSVARHLARGPKGGDRPEWTRKRKFCGRLGKNTKNQTQTKTQTPDLSKLASDVFPGPLKGAEQRRSAGGSRLALFEPQASLASRPAEPHVKKAPHA
jgi:hypothetical protein